MRDRGTTSGEGRAMTLIALGGRAEASARLDCDLPAEPSSACMARARVRGHYALRGSDDRLDDLELVVGELVANAVDASTDGQRVRVRLAHEHAHVLVEVFDHSSLPPVRRNAELLAVRGRGLEIVDALTSAWGWYPTSFGKVVWALCPAPSAQP
ncbi:ATP-binding protein [Sphaerimonospora thailandensis]|uniref:ATP-binding protein n=1 Tax=Sphaerimonospora thailandensis TaxID=795644 RepID=UPI00194E76C8|nr:ATP-binding protein [Sphaerimonospora thailandensis]